MICYGHYKKKKKKKKKCLHRQFSFFINFGHFIYTLDGADLVRLRNPSQIPRGLCEFLGPSDTGGFQTQPEKGRLTHAPRVDKINPRAPFSSRRVVPLLTRYPKDLPFSTLGLDVHITHRRLPRTHLSRKGTSSK